MVFTPSVEKEHIMPQARTFSDFLLEALCTDSFSKTILEVVQA
jgi:hypothetical protein